MDEAIKSELDATTEPPARKKVDTAIWVGGYRTGFSEGFETALSICAGVALAFAVVHLLFREY